MGDLSLGNAGAGDAEHADGCTEHQEDNLTTHINQGLHQAADCVESTRGADVVEEGLEEDEHKEHPIHLGTAGDHSAQGILEGQAANDTDYDRSDHHNQNGVAGASANNKTVGQHNDHNAPESPGGVLALLVGSKGSGLAVRLAVGLQTLGLLLGAAGHKEGRTPDNECQRNTGIDQIVCIGQAGQTGNGDHGGHEGTHIQAGSACAVEDNTQSRGSQANTGHDGDQNGSDDSVGASQGTQQGNQQGRGDHGDQDGHLLALQFKAVDHSIHQVAGNIGTGQNFCQASAQNDNKTDQCAEGTQRGIDGVGKASD